MTQFGGFGRADLLASYALFDDKPDNINQIEANFQKGHAGADPKNGPGISAKDEPHGRHDQTPVKDQTRPNKEG